MGHESEAKIDWQNWADLYDTVRYPPAIYDELVVEKDRNDQRFNVIGAWKTGCISATGGRHAYTDKNGTDYFFTNRWQAHCPVGYRVWNDLARRDPEVVVQVPSRLTLETPDLVTQLCRRKGFGFIWAVFVLHCVRPKKFPLYDQHVFRAFRWRESDGSENPKKAPDSWSQYRSYAKWFNGIVQESTLPDWIVDRAIWTYGKSVKQLDARLGEKTKTEDLQSFDDINGEWVHETTFGGQKKCFWWTIDREGTIQIQRRFRNSRKPRIKIISPGRDETDSSLHARRYMEASVEQCREIGRRIRANWHWQVSRERTRLDGHRRSTCRSSRCDSEPMRRVGIQWQVEAN
jgi:hypothetical protein